jgi:CheY-like chemotaxis protein
MNPSVVLLVEDDPLILLHLRMVLEDAGHEVLSASDADSALTLLAERPDVVALFTDVELPGGPNGVELAQKVQRSRPDVAIVVTSGRNVPANDLAPLGGRFVAKPYTAAQVRQALAG